MYDPRIGRFPSVDPIGKDFPWNSSYAFAENRVIDGKDLDGKEWQNFVSKFKDPGSLEMKLPNEKTAQLQVYSTAISNAKLSFSDLATIFKTAPQNILTNSKATFNAPMNGEGKPSQFKIGSYIKIEIPGPFTNSIVKVVGISEKKGSISATFVTMEGHVENGLINFKLTDKGNNKYEFRIVSLSDVDQGGAKIFEKTSRRKQRESWEEVLNNVVKKSGGTETKRVEEVTLPENKNKKEEIK